MRRETALEKTEAWADMVKVSINRGLLVATMSSEESGNNEFRGERHGEG